MGFPQWKQLKFWTSAHPAAKSARAVRNRRMAEDDSRSAQGRLPFPGPRASPWTRRTRRVYSGPPFREKSMFNVLAAAVLLACPRLPADPEALVSTDWVMKNLGTKNVRIVEVS